MGGRGASGLDERNKGGGGGGGTVTDERSLISERESHQQEVDDVMKVADDIQKNYNWEAMDYTVGGIGGGVMAQCDGSNVTFAESYFDTKAMNKAYAFQTSLRHSCNSLKSGIYIDGVFQAIRFFDENSKELLF